MSELPMEELAMKLQAAVKDFDGLMGVSVNDLASGDEIGVNWDERFLAASSIKIPILIELFRKAKEGAIDLEERVTVGDDVKVGGTGVLKEMGDGTATLALSDLASLMITVSDNTATNILIDVVGMEDVNTLMEGFGLSTTRLLRKMQDTEAIALGRENYATPREFMRLMAALYTGEGMDPWVSQQTLSVLMKPKTTAINRLLPYQVKVASKYGNMRDSYCDIGIIYHPERPYVISVMTKEIPEDDVRKQRTIDEISKVSRMVFDHFDSDSQR
ncbi:MAG: class A beta-lactamase-related serine hydrolase [Candidatus Bathyarchaeota archaeon]|nr:class A beta-lactamase-related serine hydrolase [Candidatus Bathyarchaeota archaeon]